MIEIYIVFELSGENFYPSRLEENLNIKFDEKNYPGEMGVTRKMLNGNATLIHNSSDFPDSEYFEKVLLIKNNSKAFGVTDFGIIMTIAHDTPKCNFELSPKLLKDIVNVGVVLGITTYERD